MSRDQRDPKDVEPESPGWLLAPVSLLGDLAHTAIKVLCKPG